MHGQRGGTVVLKGTATPCQLTGCRGLRSTLGTVGRSFVFGVMADSKRYAFLEYAWKAVWERVMEVWNGNRMKNTN